jgi:hypothetical protein
MRISARPIRDTNLSLTTLRNAALRGANFASAHLGSADLTEADLRGADLAGVTLFATTLANTRLTGAKGLESCRHEGPSSIGIDTLFSRAEPGLDEGAARSIRPALRLAPM